jgi:hypothetical protein
MVDGWMHFVDGNDQLNRSYFQPMAGAGWVGKVHVRLWEKVKCTFLEWRLYGRVRAKVRRSGFFAGDQPFDYGQIMGIVISSLSFLRISRRGSMGTVVMH